MTACSLLLIFRQPSKLLFFLQWSIGDQLCRVSPQRTFQAPNYIHSFYFHKPKNVNKNTALEIALNTFFFTIGEEFKRIVFHRSLVSSVVLVCTQWRHVTTIQLRVGFVLLTFNLKCSMPTFTFLFDIYFNLKIYFCLLYNCLSKLATHALIKRIESIAF